jgi:hypothetical protein
LLNGDGSPEGVIYATPGSLFMRRDALGATTSLYSKNSGVDLSTGWGAIGASAIFAVGSTFPLAPTAGSAFVLDAGQSFIPFVYDGTHWYSEPFAQTLLGYQAGANTWSSSVVAYAWGAPIDIQDIVAAGASVQIMLEALWTNANDGVGGDDSLAGSVQAGYGPIAGTGAYGVSSEDWVSGTIMTTTTPQNPTTFYNRSGWQAGPNSGAAFVPLVGGFAEGNSTYVTTCYAATLWFRYMK